MLGGSPSDWVAPASFSATAAPAFRVKAGGRGAGPGHPSRIATVFHLHGHHFRLLDRLDDGWKPYWLDTLAIEPGQTQRIAFAAEFAGRWLIESVATDWAAPRPSGGTVSSEETSMSTAPLTLRSVRARAVVAPIARPLKNAFGVIAAAPLVLIDVATDQGITGHSYIFAYAPLTLKPLVLLIEEIGRDLTGKAIAPFDLMAAMDAKFRLLGSRPGRHGGVRPRHGVLGRAGPGGGPAARHPARRIAAADPGL